MVGGRGVRFGRQMRFDCSRAVRGGPGRGDRIKGSGGLAPWPRGRIGSDPCRGQVLSPCRAPPLHSPCPRYRERQKKLQGSKAEQSSE